MAKVFVPEVHQLNHEEASRMGDIVPLVPESNRIGLEPDRIKHAMAKALSAFKDGDFLLLDGRNIHCAVAAAILATRNNAIDILIWDNVTHSYLARPLTLMDIPKPRAVIAPPRNFIINDIENIKGLSNMSIVLAKGHDPNFMNPERIKLNMIEYFRNSHNRDYLVISGNRMSCAVASCIMARMHKRVNYMLWHVKDDKYEYRSTTFSQDELLEIARREK